MRCKILGLFLNTSTVDNKYSPLNKENLLQHLQIQLSQKQEKHFSNLLFRFGNLDSILNIFKKEMNLAADVFLNLRTPKNVVR